MHNDNTTRLVLGDFVARLLALCAVFIVGAVVGPFIIRQLALLVPFLILLWFIISVLRAMIVRLLR
jgi:hypothetical protein